MPKSFCIILLLFVSGGLLAQRNNIWYFGKKAGVNFNLVAGQPYPSSLTDSEMTADEGSSTICDEEGNLLFYTNGLTVYNKDHKVMQNGSGLLANLSTVQSSLVIPLPGNPSIYYIFTADAVENNFANGYRYSIVDMTGDNGLGTVVAKNILINSSGTERLTAARHADGVSVWLITNDKNSNIFKAWLFSCSGFQPNPVTSVIGDVLDQHVLSNTGMMKVSPDGLMLAQTHFPDYDDANPGAQIANFFQVFDFNSATGQLSNVKKIQLPDAEYYSCEFSPDSKLLYVTRPVDSCVDQFDIKLNTVAAIQASRYTIPTGRAHYYAIQLAPDEKIYLSEPSFFIGAINRPNVKGAGANFIEEQVDLNFRLAYLGLPSYINDLSYSPLNGFDYTITDSCTGQVQFQGNTTMSGLVSWYWDFGDGNNSNLQNPVHVFTPARKAYTVKLTITSTSGCGIVKRSKTFIPSGVTNQVSFEIINRCDSGYVRFKNTSILSSNSSPDFIWDFDDGTTSTDIHPVHSFTEPRQYTIKLKLNNAVSCLQDSASTDFVFETFIIHAPPSQTILVGQTVPLWVDGRGVKYKWSPATWLSDTAAKNPIAQPLNDISYKITVTNKDGCISQDSVFIKVLPLEDIYVPAAFTPNNDGKNDILRPWYSGKLELLEFSLFNRWGERVFTTSQRGSGWNGKVSGLLQSPGVFAWIIRVKDPQGNKIIRNGTSTLIR